MVKVFRYLSKSEADVHVFYKKAIMNYFTKFTGKHLGKSLFLIKMQISVCNFIIKRDNDELFCAMVDWRKAFSLISRRDHCQRSSPSPISGTPRGGLETAQNLSSGLVEWSCAVVITTTPWHQLFSYISLGFTLLKLELGVRIGS